MSVREHRAYHRFCGGGTTTCRISERLRPKTDIGGASLCTLPSSRPHRLSHLTSSSTTQCPRIRTIRLLQPLPRPSRASLKTLWRNTKSEPRETLPPIAWPPKSSLATLRKPFSPCLKPKSRSLIRLRVPMKHGKGCWTRPSLYSTRSPGS